MRGDRRPRPFAGGVQAAVQLEAPASGPPACSARRRLPRRVGAPRPLRSSRSMRPMRCAMELRPRPSGCAASRRRCGEQEPGQGEVAEVVGAELHLEAVGGGAARQRHHARVVDEQVEPVDVAGRRRSPRTEATARRDRAAGPQLGGGGLGADPLQRRGRRRRRGRPAATRAPRRASSRAASKPMPLLAPVTTPSGRSGRGCGRRAQDGERRHRSAEGQRRAPPALRAVPSRRHWTPSAAAASRSPTCGWGRPARSRTRARLR